MTPEIKLAILFAGTLLVFSFIFVALMLQSIGTISNLLIHMETAFRAESELRINDYIAILKQNKLRMVNQVEHDRRQEALLAIPLVRNQGPRGIK